jgi:hypothetical protein
MSSPKISEGRENNFKNPHPPCWAALSHFPTNIFYQDNYGWNLGEGENIKLQTHLTWVRGLRPQKNIAYRN